MNSEPAAKINRCSKYNAPRRGVDHGGLPRAVAADIMAGDGGPETVAPHNPFVAAAPLLARADLFQLVDHAR